MMSNISLLQQLLPNGIKDIKHLHFVLMAINYVLKGFDDEYCCSIVKIIVN